MKIDSESAFKNMAQIYDMQQRWKKEAKDYAKSTPSWEYVIKDMQERNKMGAEKYNKYLTPDTKEDMLQHMYDELLDAAVYIKTLILQRDDHDHKTEKGS